MFEYLNLKKPASDKFEPEVRELKRKNTEISELSLEEFRQGKKIVSHGNSQSIPIRAIKPNPNQPRLDMDENALSELIESIKQCGLIQPITVRQTIPFQYELIAGQRRLEACRRLGMDYIPAMIMRVSESDGAVLALVENLQREDLNYIEEAEAYMTLISQYGLTQEELASRLGKSQSTIANKIRILKLSVKVRAALCEHNLTERHARALLRLKTDKERLEAIDVIVKKKLNVARTDALVERMLKKERDKPEPKEKTPSRPPRTFKDIRILSNTIKKAVELMNQSGVDAKASRREDDAYIEYIIKIPKGG